MSIPVGSPPKRSSRTIWFVVLGIFLLIAGAVGLLAYRAAARYYEPQAFPIGEFRVDEEHAANVLLSLIQEDTTNPPLQPEAFALSRERIVNLLEREYAQPLGLEVKRKDPVYTATLRAAGSTRDAVLLVASADQPPLNPEGWHCDPKGERHADELCGAGARRGKAQVVSYFEAVAALKKTGIALPFHVVIVVLFDSQGQSESALKDLTSPSGLLADRKIRVVVDGTSRLPQDFDVRSLPVTVSEKRGLWLRLFGEGDQGEAALAQEQYASERLISGLSRLAQWNKGGQRLLPTVLEFSQRMGDVVGLPRSIVYKNPSLFKTFLLRQLSRSRSSAAMLESSISTLAISAASDPGSVPTLAEAKVEVRLLPDEDPNAFLGELRRTLSDDQIGVEVLRMDPPAVEGSYAAPFFRAIEGAARQVFPQKVVVPTISPSNTPASVFAYVGTPVLRLPAPSADNAIEEITTTVELRDSIELLFQTLYGAALLEEDPFDDLVARRY